MRGLDRRLQFVDRKRCDGFPGATRTIVGVELDPVGAMARLMARGANDLVDTACFFRALRDAAIGAEFRACRTVGSGGDDRARCNLESRALRQPLLDRAL